MYTTTDKIVEYARNLEIGYGKAATMTPNDVGTFSDDADAIINARLSHAYYTPLQQITRNSITKYPDPIPFIATKIAAAMMVRSVYSRIDPQVSENANAHYNDAMNELNRFTEGEFQGSQRLQGQELKARNSFVNPRVAPLQAPNQVRQG